MEYIASLIYDPAFWASFATLTLLEIVLGIDNLVFVSIIANKVAPHDRKKAERIGLGLAMGLRLVLACFIGWIVSLTKPLFSAAGHDFSVKDLILILGGFFLIWKATKEIHHKVTHEEDVLSGGTALNLGLAAAVGNILFINMVFSLDSIITAIGMTTSVPVMVLSIIVSVGVMIIAAGPLGIFVNRNPTVVMLALSFLIMIGMTLIAEGFGLHVPKGYVYAAMAFSSVVELLNMLARRRKAAVPAAAAVQA